MELENMNDSELLTEAMKQGYNPEYEGENKKSPKEYLEIAFNHNKVLRERNDKLSNDIESMKEQMARLIEFQQEQKQKAVDKAIASLKEQRKEAIMEGDPERVERIDSEITEQQNVAKIQNNPILDEWLENNPWYIRDNAQYDEELAIEADIIGRQLESTGRFSASPADYKRLLKQVESRVKKQFPDKFKNPKKDNPPEVESGRPSSQSSSARNYTDLPPDARKICDQFVKDKLMTREQYLEIYEWDD